MKIIRLFFFSVILLASSTSISFAVCGTTELDGVWGGTLTEYVDEGALIVAYCRFNMTDGVLNAGSQCVFTAQGRSAILPLNGTIRQGAGCFTYGSIENLSAGVREFIRGYGDRDNEIINAGTAFNTQTSLRFARSGVLTLIRIDR